ncbi:MurR/RpiR family transcriptional regulator [Tropicibacter oceani]|uniref:MurR/RpiR family transcriptional regulator n=1 Tax=Tropicibacter oceani TaxID=3058420 RepID=A0ABY8QKR4_9RHOB|nr:MurR/RpiR family transcriptional regulator [Tropicibacter oceani]WGW04727.1 MurR/RpiR family transcriptional regulator [Tropicibacter oceani]
MTKASAKPGDKPLIRDMLRDQQANLTAAERRLSATLLDDSLVAGLQSITRLAESAEVSTASVVRLARKLGFEGFSDFQNAIRDEVAARVKQPLAKLETTDVAGHCDHIISRFARAMSRNINATIDRLDVDEFEQVTDLLADPKRHIYLMGGRITRSNANYFFNHLQIIRPGVSLLDASPSVWPQSLLDMDENATLVVFDIRRYEKQLERLAKLVTQQGGNIVLFTDQWGSPIETYAAYCFRSMVEAPSSWDSTLAINFLIEALIAGIQARSSGNDRIAALEQMIGAARIFRGS